MSAANEHRLLRRHARDIFSAGLERVNPTEMVANALAVRDRRLTCVIDEVEAAAFDLDRYREIVVIGFGKAGAAMAAGAERVLGDLIQRGAVSVKYGHLAPVERIEILEAGHPVPDEAAVRAAGRVAQLARDAGEDSLVINLVSGGGSALLTLPFQDDNHHLTLSDMQATTQALLDSGATIQEINCIRRHLSAVKGGRLAEMMAPATSLNLILSDVVGDELTSIASGPTVPDPTTFADARAIVDRYQVSGRLPAAVTTLLTDGEAGRVADTPKPGSPVFSRSHTIVLGSNLQALQAAAARAEKLGYETVILSSRIEGEAREIARFYAGIAADLSRTRDAGAVPCCLIAGGETTVTIRGTGLGGRNQEMAAAVLLEMARTPQRFADTLFLSGATDGTDGPTDAAGGMADTAAVKTLAGANPDVSAEARIRAALADNDSYRLLQEANTLIVTGPTNTNVCDVQLILYTGGLNDD